MKLPPILYINLDRETERKKYIEDEFSKYGIKNYTRLSAIDGQNVEELNKYCVPNPNLNKGENALVCSYIKALKYFVENIETDICVIFEDDVSFDYWKDIPFKWDEFYKELPYWDVIQMGVTSFTTTTKLNKRKIDDWGAIAVLWNKRSAKNLLNKLKYVNIENTTKVDLTIYPIRSGVADSLIYSNNEFVYTIPLFCTKTFPSSVQEVNKNPVIEQIWKQQKEQWGKYSKQDKLIVQSEGCGYWAHQVMEYLIKNSFTDKNVIFDYDRKYPVPNLIVRSGFLHQEGEINSSNIPYVLWSGESYKMPRKTNEEPILEIVSFIDDKAFYLPYMVFSDMNFLYDYRNKVYNVVPEKNCCFVASNFAKKREKFWDVLKTKLDKCDEFGKIRGRQPLDGDWKDLTDTYSKYKFVIAMENVDKKGYITEKIINAYRAGAIPIYWGSDRMIERIFNPDSFINLSDFENDEKCVEYICELANNPLKWLEIKNQPIFKNNIIPDVFKYKEPVLPTIYSNICMTLRNNYLKLKPPGENPNSVVSNINFIDSNLPLLGACVMVKNEITTMDRTLSSIKNCVDVVTILDTGSTDGTQNFIRNKCKEYGLECNIYEDEWIDFATCRNKLLEHGRKHSRFMLLLDANEELIEGAPLKQFLKENINDHIFSVNYHILNELGPGSLSIFDRFSILRNDVNIYYKYKVHENLFCPDSRKYINNKTLLGVPMCIKNDRSLDKPSTDRLKNDLKVLLEELKESPDIRTHYYLGQTYMGLKDYYKARDHYMKTFSKALDDGVFSAFVSISLCVAHQATINLEIDKTPKPNDMVYEYDIFWDERTNKIDTDKYIELYTKTFSLKGNNVILIEPYVQVVKYLLYYNELDNIEKYMIYLTSLVEPHKYLCEMYSQKLYIERWQLIIRYYERVNKTENPIYAYAKMMLNNIANNNGSQQQQSQFTPQLLQELEQHGLTKNIIDDLQKLGYNATILVQLLQQLLQQNAPIKLFFEQILQRKLTPQMLQETFGQKQPQQSQQPQQPQQPPQTQNTTAQQLQQQMMQMQQQMQQMQEQMKKMNL